MTRIYKTFTPKRKETKLTDVTCDICGKDAFNRAIKDIQTEIRYYSSDHCFHDIDICKDCFDAIWLILKERADAAHIEIPDQVQEIFLD